MYLLPLLVLIPLTTALAAPPQASSATPGTLPILHRSLGLTEYPTCELALSAAVLAALDHDVDPFGPMPTDYTSSNDFTITFLAGSNFSFWLSAQPGDTSVHNRRVDIPEGSGVDIVLWEGKTCGQGHGTLHTNIEPDGWYYSLGENYALELRGSGIMPGRGKLELYAPTYGSDLKSFVWGSTPGCSTNLPAYGCVHFETVR
ncbi:hypothetical protein K440DRAFT_642552 [Wilcoxina mikolae CBS 423.85]|nr:hypothetical protein K440DRAFT_642552 [Wilcoxina mikolae CBS 423.85]